MPLPEQRICHSFDKLWLASEPKSLKSGAVFRKMLLEFDIFDIARRQRIKERVRSGS